MTTVSTRALISRINRRLARDGEHLRKSRPNTSESHNFGTYYIVNPRINRLVASNVDLEEVGRDLGVLRPDEIWEEES